MTKSNLIQNQQQFTATATDFFNTLFDPSLQSNRGDIEIRTFPKNQPPKQIFCKSEADAAQLLLEKNCCNFLVDCRLCYTIFHIDF